MRRPYFLGCYFFGFRAQCRLKVSGGFGFRGFFGWGLGGFGVEGSALAKGVLDFFRAVWVS